MYIYTTHYIALLDTTTKPTLSWYIAGAMLRAIGLRSLAQAVEAKDGVRMAVGQEDGLFLSIFFFLPFSLLGQRKFRVAGDLMSISESRWRYTCMYVYIYI